ncbi:MAG: hypothetical protein IPK19_24935 [Chloroflexi bacterium]|nr:hypothetical protein [Chloroflexota bacterium]
MLFLGPVALLGLSAVLFSMFFPGKRNTERYGERHPVASVVMLLGLFLLVIVLPTVLASLGILHAP